MEGLKKMKTLIPAARRLLTPPIFADEDKTHTANLLNTILWTCLAGSMFLALAYPILMPAQGSRLLILGPVPPLTLGLIILMKKGYVRLTSLLFSGLIWAVFALASITGGGIRAPGYASYLIAILIASLLLGQRFGRLFTFLSVLFGLVLVLAEMNGNALPSLVRYSSSTLWIIYTIIFLIGMFILDVANRSLNENLARARQNERSLAASIRQFQQQTRALQESEELYRTLFESAPLGLGLANTNGEIIAYNEAMISPGGYGHDDIGVLQNVAALYYDPADRLKIMLSARQQGFVDRAEVQFRRKDGTPYDVRLSLRPVRLDGLFHWQAMVEDITESKRAREELEAVQQQLQHLLAASPSVIYSAELDEDFPVTFVSSNIKNQFGYQVGECLGNPKWWMDHVHPEDLPRVMAELAALSQDDHYAHEYRFRHKNGDYRFIYDDLRLVRDTAGDPQEIVGSWIDVTQRKQAEREREQLLRETQKRATELAILLESATVVSSMLELESVLQAIAQQLVKAIGANGCTLSRWNKVADTVSTWIEYRCPGYERTDSIGTSYSLPAYPATRQVLQSGRPLTVHSHDPNADAAESALMRRLGVSSLLMLPIVMGQEVLGLIELDDGTRVRDFTPDEIRLCQALANQAAVAITNAQLLQSTQQQARQMEHILEAVQEGIILLDEAHCVQLANPTGALFLEALAQAEIGDVITRLGRHPLKDFLNRAPADGLWHGLAIPEQQRYFELAAPHLETGPQKGGWVLILRETTEERRHQEYQQAQERLATVGQLAAGVAHDFSNILAVISLYSDLVLKSPGLPLRIQEYMTTIQQQSQQAASLIGQIVDFSRRSVMERTSFEVVPFTKKLIGLLKRTLPENITIRFEYEKGRYIINADPARLQQVLMNLSVNARDAMPDGGELSILLASQTFMPGQKAPLPDMSPGDWLMLTITDSGKGIEAKHLPHVFEPFFTTKAPGEGTGLGLAQVYGIIKQHNGHIEVSSQLGKETTFTIYLPMIVVRKTAPLEPNRVEDSPNWGHGETILVVEDNAATREAVSDTLKMLGYQIIEAADGEEALRRFEHQAGEIDLVLSDLVMPGMGGEALLQALRQKEPHVRMVMMTGYPLVEKSKALLEQGGVTWLSKPFTAHSMAEVVHKAVTV